ncbi:MAG TPA: DUF1844 domain-containing protein [Terriglobia bacterium]|nr:DUF1844 domain-containing protein [Terriglobia bacterium]
MPEEKDEPTFKVVDRRSFAADGTPVAQTSESTKQREASAAPPPRRQPEPQPRPEPEPSPEDFLEGADEGFAGLLSELYTGALVQMGLVTGPNGEALPPDLVGAHRTIDLVETLQKKTRGNLTAKESRLLEQILYELRLSFVEINKRFAPKQK